MPKYIWLASGGKSQLKPEKLSVLKGRRVIAFPDVDGYQEWKEKLSKIEGLTITVSDVLEKTPPTKNGSTTSTSPTGSSNGDRNASANSAEQTLSHSQATTTAHGTKPTSIRKIVPHSPIRICSSWQNTSHPNTGLNLKNLSFISFQIIAHDNKNTNFATRKFLQKFRVIIDIYDCI